MKTIHTAIALAASLALAACGGGNDDTAATETMAPTPMETAPAMTGAQGTYTGTNAAGQPWTASLRSDGTYEFTENGEVTQFGTYTEGANGTCLTEDTGETAAPAEEMCYNFGEVGADGTVTVTGPDGAAFTMNKQQG